MKARELFVEVRRNLSTGTARAALFALAFAAVVGSLAVADTRTVVGLHRKAFEFTSSGASVRVLSSEGNVDGRACESLSGLSGIATAGALREDGHLVLTAMPDNPIPTYTASPGLSGVLGLPTEPVSGVWISEHTAELLGVGLDQEMHTNVGPMTVAGIFAYPEDGRDSRLRHAVVVPESATNDYDQCWADTRPPTDTIDDLVMWALRSGTEPSSSVTVAQLNTTLGSEFDGATAFTERITRWAAPTAAVAGAVLGFTAVRLRRLEWAGALHVGVSRRALLGTVALETAVWAPAGLALALCALVVAAHVGNPAHAWDTVAVTVPGVVAATLTAQVGALTAASLVRESHLFRYFKDR